MTIESTDNGVMPIVTPDNGRDAQGPAKRNPFIVKERAGHVPPATDRTQDNPTGPANGNVPDAEKPAKKPRLVQRATVLRGLCANPPQKSPRARRIIAERDLIETAGLPMESYGKELRKILCSLAERQDQKNEDLLLRIRDLEYRVGDLEQGRHPDDDGGS